MGGGTAQVLIMQAEKYFNLDIFGFIRQSMGSISPGSILYQGEEYEILSFFSYKSGENTVLSFSDDKFSKIAKLIIQVNGAVYTLIRTFVQIDPDAPPTDQVFYGCDKEIFTSYGTYTIKILSIE